jgi:flagellar FliL protein
VLGLLGGYVVKGKRADGAAGAAAPTTTSPPKPGEMVEIPTMSVNLADGHFLRIGLALQLVKGEASAEWQKLHGPPVRDLMITVFSGKGIQELAQPEGREKVRQHLLEAVREHEGDAVMSVYFTEYVMQ